MKKILLLCAAGMSTSMVVKKMRQAAEEQHIDVLIEAKSVETITDNIDEFDLFLLGPQIRFRHAELEKMASARGKTVDVIDMSDYGMMRGDKILAKAMSHFVEA